MIAAVEKAHTYANDLQFKIEQGSVRAVMNNNGVGTSTVIARHDYLPYGEEIGANVGLRTSAQGYNVPDSNRQKYAMLERDGTGLDHTWWRM